MRSHKHFLYDFLTYISSISSALTWISTVSADQAGVAADAWSVSQHILFKFQGFKPSSEFDWFTRRSQGLGSQEQVQPQLISRLFCVCCFSAWGLALCPLITARGIPAALMIHRPCLLLLHSPFFLFLHFSLSFRH